MGRSIRFVNTRWGKVAFAVVGSGPPVVFDTGWISNLEVMWKHGGYRHFVERLAESHSVICFDALGCGLSDRVEPLSPLGEEEEILGSVLSGAGIGEGNQVSLFCSSIAVCTAIQFAAHNPTSVLNLILYGGALRGGDVAAEDAQTALLQLIRTHWGLGSQAMTDLFVPGLGVEERGWFDSWQRQSTDSETAARRLQMFYETDASADAPLVEASTLVVHRSGDRAVPLTQGAAVAAAIPGAELEVLEGTEHPCFLGDWESVADIVIRFLSRTSRSTLPHGPFGDFTARELDVAELTVEGLTNASIGETLGISPRTVETHLGHIRDKLGVRTRAEVAAWMARRPDIG